LYAECGSEKNYENRSTVGEDMGKNTVPRFYKPPCTRVIPKVTGLDILDNNI